MVYVTGSNGFIGRHMVGGLSKLRRSALVHMAAISDTTCDDWQSLYNVNVRWTLALADDCRSQGIPFVYASSAAVYGNGAGPLNDYARSKLAVDMVMEKNDDPDFRWYGLRFFNVWGDGEDDKGRQASLIHRLKCGLAEVWEPDVKRDFVHVGDCVSVVRWIIDNKPPSGIYDVGTGEPVSIRQLVDKYAVGDVEVVPIPPELEPRYQRDTKADLSKLRSVGYDWPFRSPL